jgi:hypothetical protein
MVLRHRLTVVSLGLALCMGAAAAQPARTLRLFSRAAPPSVTVDESAAALLEAFREVAPSQDLFLETLAVVRAHLIVQHGFGLTPEDLSGIEYVLSAFLYAGPSLAYANTGRMARYPSYQDLMAATDEVGVARSYLASEDLYGRLRSLQVRNLIVPVVGDFAGPKALRQVGTIYTSNVEQYLFQYGTWKAYYDVLAHSRE